jgi:mono/diheme cytochrome c family protein
MKKTQPTTALIIALTFAAWAPAPLKAQNDKASARERAGAVAFGAHCSTCHGVRLMKADSAYDLVEFIKTADEERFIRGSKTARGSMPTFANVLSDREISDIYAYVKRGHTPDLNDVPMESNH